MPLCSTSFASRFPISPLWMSIRTARGTASDILLAARKTGQSRPGGTGCRRPWDAQTWQPRTYGKKSPAVRCTIRTASDAPPWSPGSRMKRHAVPTSAGVLQVGAGANEEHAGGIGTSRRSSPAQAADSSAFNCRYSARHCPCEACSAGKQDYRGVFARRARRPIFIRALLTGGGPLRGHGSSSA